MTHPHTQTPKALAQALGSDLAAGLTQAQAEELSRRWGENRLEERKKRSTLQRFLDQFKDAMILILLLAAGVSFFAALGEGDTSEFFEPALILLIVVLNALVGVLQENKAEKALDALRGLSAPHAKVLREGREQLIEGTKLVPGDIILLEAGDVVPADARLLRASSLAVEESALTGESLPAEKEHTALVEEDAPLGDRRNMVYSGCGVTYGSAQAMVTATGMDTEMGKIAGLLGGERESRTPLQEKLAGLGKSLGLLALAACAVIFVVGLLDGMAVMEIFMISVSLAVSAIPEGLPAIVTVVLSIGVRRMAERGAIIRRLPAVETLGSASVICSDKTGTLTQNRMTLTHLWREGEQETESVTAKEPFSEKGKQLLELAALCCNGAVSFPEGPEGPAQHIGDPTETAILVAVLQGGRTKEQLNQKYPRLLELPFDSQRKRMCTVNRIGDTLTVIVKGAFDSIAQRCTEGDLDTAARMVEEMSEKALRVLAVAVKTIPALPEGAGIEELESGLTLLGLVGMIDPPRQEAKEAVALCRRAGIRPVMITGDHVITASAIARELGILREGDGALTGRELSALSQEELDAKVEGVSVYARVSPEDKIRIVKAWQKRGAVAAMTGDGVNDAPALKAADIGCAMGITGTDVAKGAADMVLTDDNFATIVEAVREGRGIYENIRKVVGFLLGTNIGEVLVVFFAMLLWRQSPLLSMQLLWINLVTDSMPAIALGMEPVEPGLMDRAPKPREEGIFARGLGLRVALQGAMFAALSLVSFWLGLQRGGLAPGRTMAFITLAVSQLVQAYNMRSHRSLFQMRAFGNRTLNLACGASLLLMLVVVFTPLRIPFGLTVLPPSGYFTAFGLCLVPLVVMEAAKAAGMVKA